MRVCRYLESKPVMSMYFRRLLLCPILGEVKVRNSPREYQADGLGVSISDTFKAIGFDFVVE